MQVLVNGEPRELEPQATVHSLVASLSDARPGRGLAVAVDGEVVPRGEWGTTRLEAGARLEIVAAVQGG